jgi:chemotaxis protein CheD
MSQDPSNKGTNPLAGEENMKKHYLYPSALFAERTPYLVDTVLGSCVAVCLFDDHKKIGGINHFMLPLWNGEGLATPKYGNIAIEKLIERMIQLGCKKEHLKAKLFGGASQINSSMEIGLRNVEIAKEILAQYRIPIIAENVFGKVGRKLRYDTGTGQVMMKFLTNSNQRDNG